MVNPFKGSEGEGEFIEETVGPIKDSEETIKFAYLMIREDPGPPSRGL